MTEQPIRFSDKAREEDNFIRLMTLAKLDNAFNIKAKSFTDSSFERIPDEVIDNFTITPDYRQFSSLMLEERKRRPAALRDILALPADLTHVDSEAEFTRKLGRYSLVNNGFAVRGLECEADESQEGLFTLRLTDAIVGLKSEHDRLTTLSVVLKKRFGDAIEHAEVTAEALLLKANGKAADYLSRIFTLSPALPLSEVQPAHEITRTFASGAMSHGALVAPAHEAVAHGTNMVGGMSNCGEGGEHYSRHGTIRASRIKQLASGRFGVWAAYLADPMLEELEIKIGQGQNRVKAVSYRRPR